MPRRVARPRRAQLRRIQQGQRGKRMRAGDDSDHPRPDAQPDPDPAQRDGRGHRPRVFLERANQAQQQQRHGDRERCVLRVHEHVPVVERADGEQHEGTKPGERAADPPADPPGDEQTHEPDCGADQSSCFEQIERKNLRHQCGRHVEAATVHVQIDERECSQVLEARPVQRQQQIAVFRMGIIVPSEPVIPKRKRGDHGDRTEQRDGGAIDHASERSLVGTGGHGFRDSR